MIMIYKEMQQIQSSNVRIFDQIDKEEVDGTLISIQKNEAPTRAEESLSITQKLESQKTQVIYWKVYIILSCSM